MPTTQKTMIAFVNAHRCGFATPAADGAVWIYSYAVDRSGHAELVRDLARNASECRAGDCLVWALADDHAEFNAEFEAMRQAAGPHNPLSL